MERIQKLVRDKIPEIMRAKGQTPVSVTSLREDPDKAMVFLERKLLEETYEVFDVLHDYNRGFQGTETGDSLRDILIGELIGELGDLKEVIRTIEKMQGITDSEVEAARRRKLEERGGFDDMMVQEFNYAGDDPPTPRPFLKYFVTSFDT